MRDPELLVALMDQMASEADGALIETRTYGMGEEKRTRIHHLDLLTDAGLAVKTSDHSYRITSQGYDFLAASKQPGMAAKLEEFLGRGIRLVDAAAKLSELAAKLT